MPLHVEAGHLERREHLIDGAGRGDHARGAHRGVVTAKPLGNRGANGVEREHVLAGDRLGGGGQAGQVPGVGVGLAQPDQSGVGVQLDDRAQRERLMHADGVEQRRVDERDGGDARAGDADPTGGHQRAAASSSAITARPASMMRPSAARSSGDGMISGARTGPASRPSMVTPALISDTA